MILTRKEITEKLMKDTDWEIQPIFRDFEKKYNSGRLDSLGKKEINEYYTKCIALGESNAPAAFYFHLPELYREFKKQFTDATNNNLDTCSKFYDNSHENTAVLSNTSTINSTYRISAFDAFIIYIVNVSEPTENFTKLFEKYAPHYDKFLGGKLPYQEILTEEVEGEEKEEEVEEEEEAENQEQSQIDTKGSADEKIMELLKRIQELEESEKKHQKIEEENQEETQKLREENQKLIKENGELIEKKTEKDRLENFQKQIKEHEEKVAKLDDTIKEKNETIKEKNETIAALDKTTEEKKAELEKINAVLASKQDIVNRVAASDSYKLLLGLNLNRDGQPQGPKVEYVEIDFDKMLTNSKVRETFQGTSFTTYMVLVGMAASAMDSEEETTTQNKICPEDQEESITATFKGLNAFLISMSINSVISASDGDIKNYVKVKCAGNKIYSPSENGSSMFSGDKDNVVRMKTLKGNTRGSDSITSLCRLAKTK